jgi:hypothetical protein
VGWRCAYLADLLAELTERRPSRRHSGEKCGASRKAGTKIAKPGCGLLHAGCVCIALAPYEKARDVTGKCEDLLYHMTSQLGPFPLGSNGLMILISQYIAKTRQTAGSGEP